MKLWDTQIHTHTLPESNHYRELYMLLQTHTYTMHRFDAVEYSLKGIHHSMDLLYILFFKTLSVIVFPLFLFFTC